MDKSARSSRRWVLRRRIALLWLTACLTLLSGGCAAGNRSPEFRIGFLSSFTGELKAYGTSTLEGAALAAETENRAGGLLVGSKRYKVVLVLKDCQNSPEKAVSSALELFNREDVSAIVGPPLSGLAIPVARLAEKASVPMIAQIATNPEVTEGKTHVFRTCYTDDFQGEVLARFAYEQLQARNAALLYDVSGAYNRGIAEIFTQKFSQLGGHLVTAETYTAGERDFRAQLLRIQKGKPDVLLLPNYLNDLGPQLGQLHELGLRVCLLGGDSMNLRNPEDIAEIEGAYFSTHFSLDNPDLEVQAFIAAYTSAYGNPPAPGGVLSYDALKLLFEAARSQGGVDTRSLTEGLRGIRRFVGVSGIMDFAGSCDPRKSAIINRVQKGEFRFVTRIDP